MRSPQVCVALPSTSLLALAILFVCGKIHTIKLAVLTTPTVTEITCTLLATVTTIHPQNRFHLEKLKLCTHGTVTPHSPLPSTPGHHQCTFCPHEFDYFKYSM